MSDYLKLFQAHSAYNTYINGNNVSLPNVSFCQNENEIHYNPIDFSKRYLATVARESGTISFNIWQTMGTDLITSISYSTDNGETWTTTNNQNNKSDNLQITVNVNAGDKVLWKGVAQQMGYYDEEEMADYVGSFFSSDCEFDVQGNVMSLCYGDNFIGENTLEYVGQFAYLFYDYNENLECNVVNAKDLSLPATTLTEGCYADMFWNCSSLTSAPQLPATTLAYGCYESMFYNCTQLVKAPVLPATTLANQCYIGMFTGCTSLVTATELPATTLAEGCYAYMFQDCTSLTTAPALPATTLANQCYGGMFRGCTSLVTAPVLPATTLSESCYRNMFTNCTSLTTAPALPATTLADYCYDSMFSGCSSLTTAPVLPATTLVDNCYYYMFSGCTSLTTAPELPATTLATRCYNQMFSGCSSLNYIKAMFTTTPSGSSPNYYTSDWVQGVAASGTFVKNSAATWNVTGDDGVPYGWTIQTASA